MTARSDTRKPAALVIAPPPILAWLLGAIGVAMDRRAQRARLAALDERLLRDIGLTPAQALAEARRPWWQGRSGEIGRPSPRGQDAPRRRRQHGRTDGCAADP